MWHQDKYTEALKFAAIAHKDQKVTGSEMSYLAHVTNVAMEVIAGLKHTTGLDEDLAVQCALLHDTIEDTDVSYNDIAIQFGKETADGVLALTKNEKLPKHQQMKESLSRICKQGTEVAIVKIADRITNLQKPPYFWTAEKKKNYLEEAELILDILSNSCKYLENRLSSKINGYRSYIENE